MGYARTKRRVTALLLAGGDQTVPRSFRSVAFKKKCGSKLGDQRGWTALLTADIRGEVQGLHRSALLAAVTTGGQFEHGGSMRYRTPEIREDLLNNGARFVTRGTTDHSLMLAAGKGAPISVISG